MIQYAQITAIIVSALTITMNAIDRKILTIFQSKVVNIIALIFRKVFTALGITFNTILEIGFVSMMMTI